LGNYPIALNLNEFLAIFCFLQLLQVCVGYNGAACICTQVVVVQKVYVHEKYWFRARTSSKFWFFRRELSSGLEKDASKRAKGQVCMCREI
jgi:hypothetical protein